MQGGFTIRLRRSWADACWTPPDTLLRPTLGLADVQRSARRLKVASRRRDVEQPLINHVKSLINDRVRPACSDSFSSNETGRPQLLKVERRSKSGDLQRRGELHHSRCRLRRAARFSEGRNDAKPDRVRQRTEDPRELLQILHVALHEEKRSPVSTHRGCRSNPSISFDRPITFRRTPELTHPRNQCTSPSARRAVINSGYMTSTARDRFARVARVKSSPRTSYTPASSPS